jgi:hypothetical protein
MTSRNEDGAATRLEHAFGLPEADLPVEVQCDPDTRTIGVAFAAFKKSVQVNLAQPPAVTTAAVGADADDAAITKTLQGYESLSPSDFGSQWRNYATDPHMGVGTSWVGTVDDDAVAHWQQSDALAKAVAAYPPYSPRQVTLQDVAITYIGTGRAAATYRAVEQHTNGQQTAGNAAAILMNTTAGWRICVVTKGGRGEI